MKNALILLAGGLGKRLRTKDPKQFLKIGNSNFIEYFLSNLDNKIFDIIIIAVNKKHKEKYLKNIKSNFKEHNIVFSPSGNSRQLSTFNSLKLLYKYSPKNVLIHDSARPLATNELIKRILTNLKKNISCIPFISHNDLIKTKKSNIIKNNKIINIQTPQGFNFKKIYLAHKLTNIISAKDDSTIFENYFKNINLKMINGEISNIKITKKQELDFFKKFKNKEFKSGIGYDVHKINFSSRRKLKLCGVKISHPPLIGHSDADVGFHAVCDSILGALSMRDIGFLFKNNDKKWKNIDSSFFIKFCFKMLNEKGYKIVNLDINFICEKPNINKYSKLMINNLSSLLKISKNKISIKATTNEKIGFIGNGEGIAAESIVQIVNV